MGGHWVIIAVPFTLALLACPEMLLPVQKERHLT
jgi:hypothetical protein